MVRWPGKIKAGQVSTEMFSGLDWFPTLLAAAGDTDVKERLLKGADIGGKTFKVHLDGYNQLAYLTGKKPKGERTDFLYFNDDGDMVAFRQKDWKVVFCQMPVRGGLAVWYAPFECLRIPKLYNLRMDPYERADNVSDQYDAWRVDNAYFRGWRRFTPPASWRRSSSTRRARSRRASRSTDREGRRGEDQSDGREARRQIGVHCKVDHPGRQQGARAMIRRTLGVAGVSR